MSFFDELSRSLKAATADSARAPYLKCPACGTEMVHVLDDYRMAGYRCFGNSSCVGFEISVEELADPDRYPIIVAECLTRKAAFDEMRQRNGYLDRPPEHAPMFEAIREPFCRERGINPEQLPLSLKRYPHSPLAIAWRSHLDAHMVTFCLSCNGWHLPTQEHPRCRLCTGLHEQMRPDLFIDFRGWRFTSPFICMGCGIEVCFRQWAFSRSCGPCDLSTSHTRRLWRRQCFAGPHEKLSTWGDDRLDLVDDNFVDPTKRNQFPIGRP